MMRRLILACLLSFVAVGGEDEKTIELSSDEQALVNYHRQEMLWRRQIYRETSMRLQERRAKYEKDLKKAQADKARFAKELTEVEAADPVNVEELERVLKGGKAAERAIGICLEALLVVETAEKQFASHRKLIAKSRARIRKAVGAEEGHCALHKVKLDYVRVPVTKPEGKQSAEEVLMRIRKFPVPAEPFRTEEAGTPAAP